MENEICLELLKLQQKRMSCMFHNVIANEQTMLLKEKDFFFVKKKKNVVFEIENK